MYVYVCIQSNFKCTMSCLSHLCNATLVSGEIQRESFFRPVDVFEDFFELIFDCKVDQLRTAS